MPLVTGRRPIETSTRSNEWTPSNSGPSVFTSTFSPAAFSSTTFVPSVNAREAFAQSLFERLHQVAVGAGQEAVEQFDDGDL